MNRVPFTATADLRAPMPDGPGARLDRIHAAVASLVAEERRLERLGLDDAARRCRGQRRYWEFLAAVFTLEPETETESASGAIDWDALLGRGDAA